MIILKAVAAATGRTEARIKEALKEEGDLGTIAVKVSRPHSRAQRIKGIDL